MSAPPLALVHLPVGSASRGAVLPGGRAGRALTLDEAELRAGYEEYATLYLRAIEGRATTATATLDADGRWTSDVASVAELLNVAFGIHYAPSAAYHPEGPRFAVAADVAEIFGGRAERAGAFTIPIAGAVY